MIKTRIVRYYRPGPDSAIPAAAPDSGTAPDSTIPAPDSATALNSAIPAPDSVLLRTYSEISWSDISLG